VIKIQPPCEACPIHLRGLEKSGEVCRRCPARLAYIEALGDDNILMGRSPLPDLTPPPEAEHVYTNADMAIAGHTSSSGPRFIRKTLKKAAENAANPVGRPTAIRTVMAARRLALGLTQDEVADAAGSTTRTIAWIESGKYHRTPKPSTLNAIARVLKIDDPAMLMMPPSTAPGAIAKP